MAKWSRRWPANPVLAGSSPAVASNLVVVEKVCYSTRTCVVYLFGRPNILRFFMHSPLHVDIRSLTSHGKRDMLCAGKGGRNMHSPPPDAGKIQRTLELARNAVNTGKPDRAIELVSSLGLDGEQDGFERFWAESRLILAEAYMAKRNPVAETFFEEALASIVGLPERDSLLEQRANEHYADYLCNFVGCRSKSRPKYDLAKQFAVENHS